MLQHAYRDVGDQRQAKDEPEMNLDFHPQNEWSLQNAIQRPKEGSLDPRTRSSDVSHRMVPRQTEQELTMKGILTFPTQ